MIPAKSPSVERVRTFRCPKCKADPGKPCREASVERRHHHAERVQDAQAWLGKQLTLDV